MPTAEVLQDAKVLVIPLRDFNELLLQYPHTAINLMHTMEQKIVELQARLQKLIAGDVQRRVVHFLTYLAKEFGEKTAVGTMIDVPVTNEDIANVVGTSRESVNRILNHLKREHLLDIGRQKMCIYDIEALQ